MLEGWYLRRCLRLEVLCAVLHCGLVVYVHRAGFMARVEPRGEIQTRQIKGRT